MAIITASILNIILMIIALINPNLDKTIGVLFFSLVSLTIAFILDMINN
jgi:hypothetical protein